MNIRKNRILTLLVTISMILAILVIIPSVSAASTCSCSSDTPGYIGASSEKTSIIKMTIQTDEVGTLPVYVERVKVNFSGAGFTTSDLANLADDETSGVQLWRDYDNDGVFDGAPSDGRCTGQPTWQGNQCVIVPNNNLYTKLTQNGVDYVFFIIIRTSASVSDDDHITAEVVEVLVNNSAATISGDSNVTTIADTLDPVVPSDALTAPNSGEQWSGTQTITWNNSDITDSHFNSTPIRLYYSSNGGTSWTQIDGYTANDGSYSWDTTTVSDGANYKIKIEAVDNASNTANDTSDATFTIDNTAPTCSIEYNSSSTYFAAGTKIKIFANFTEALSGMNSSSVTISISTPGDGDLAETSMNMTDFDHYYYNWTIPSGSDDDGAFTVMVNGSDNASNSVTETDSSKYIDNTGPTVTIVVPVNGNWYASMNQIKGSCSDSLSGVNAVNLTIFNASSGKYWNGTGWDTGVNWSSANLAANYSWWTFDSSSVTWANGTTYLINATGIDNVSNVGSADSNNFSLDTNGLNSAVTTITPYWQTTSPITIEYNATDYGSGLNNVVLKYRYSSDNSSWGSWTTFGSPDTTPWNPGTWSFNFPDGSGFYEFYTIATDNVSNQETKTTNDTICGYDPNPPTGNITLPVNGSFYKSGDPIDTNITGTATDPRGVTNVYVYIYNATDNTYFNGTGWQASPVNLSANLSGGTPTTNWWYENTSAFPTWATSKTYIINISTVDTPGNWNETTATASFLYDTNNPTATITSPGDGVWLNDLDSITGTASDTGGSGVATVNITIYNSTDNKYWTGSAWGASATNLTATGTTSWSYDCSGITWANGSTYMVNATATDNAGNIGSTDSHTFYIDTDDLSSQVNAISPYWQTSSPLTISITASDAGSGLYNVTLYYYYSSDNNTFYGPFNGGVNNTPWLNTTAINISFDFTVNGSGYYGFYSVAVDNASNVESAPGSADAICGFDNVAPSSSVDVISPYWQNSSPLTVNVSASDVGVSGVASVTLYVRNSTDNSSWSGWWSFGSDSSSPYSFSFNFPNGTGYYEFYSVAVDNASNTESAPGSADAICGFDNVAPSSSVDAISSYWQTSSPLTITVTASDADSGLDTVMLYYYYSSDNITFSGPQLFGTDNDPWVGISWSFTFPNGPGYYRFYSIATDNASNTESAPVTNDTMCGYDPSAPDSSVNAISPYWQTSSPLTISITTSDAGSGLYNVTLYYYYSSDNNTFYGPFNGGVNNTPWLNTTAINISFDFTTNGTGYYRFYSIATDNASNTESAPVTNDTMCGYDNVAPTSSVDTITPYWKSSTTTITASASDATSGVASVTLYYRFSSDNSSWGSWVQNDTDSSYPFSWSFSFPNGTGFYEFYSRATDNASNVESAPANNDTICGYDTNAPSVSNVLINDTTVPSLLYVKDGDSITVTATITDLQLSSGDTSYLYADLSGFGGSATATATAYNGTVAWWNLSSVTCNPGNGTITVTINATDPAGNYNNTEYDTITADNAPPTFSYAVMDADNDGTNYSYVDIYFSETLNTSTVAYTDFNISISGVSPTAVQTATGNLVTLKFSTTFQTGDSPTIGIVGSISDIVGNTLTSGTVTIETFNISLSAGLNLISFPCDVSTEALTTVLADLTGTWTIYRYNATLNTWQYYNPATGYYPSNVQWNLTGGEGYWISIGTAQHLSGNYNLWPNPGYSMPSYTLKGQSWNLIGHWQTYNQSASTSPGGALASLSDSDIGSLWRYNPGGGYTNILIGAQNMEPGKGYWLWKETTGDKEYTPS